MYIKKCVICGETFTSSNCKRITCSDECKERRKKERETEYYQNNREKFVENHKKNYVSKKKEHIKFCVHCKKRFTTNQNAQKYCSEECKIVANKQPKGIRTFVCEFCGSRFETDFKRKYCSVECRENAKRSASKCRKPKKPKLSLNQIAKLCREEGMSYG